jgi:hypothetical protein
VVGPKRGSVCGKIGRSLSYQIKLLSLVLIRGASWLTFDFNDEDEGTRLFCEEAGRGLLARTVIL